MNNKQIPTEGKSKPVSGNFFVLYEDEEAYIYGWIDLEGTIEDLKYRIQGEIEYAWGFEYSDIEEYNFFNIEIGNHYNLCEIYDNNYFEKIKNQNEIFIVLLHRSIKTRLIENLPEIYEWIRDGVFYL